MIMLLRNALFRTVLLSFYLDFVRSFSPFGMDQAIKMLRSGISQQNVALDLAVSVRYVKRWWSMDKIGMSLETEICSGKPTILNRVNRMIISKTLTIRRQSTRKIAKNLNTSSDPVSHMTVYRYLIDYIGASVFKRQKIPVYRQKKTSKID